MQNSAVFKLHFVSRCRDAFNFQSNHMLLIFPAHQTVQEKEQAQIMKRIKKSVFKRDLFLCVACTHCWCDEKVNEDTDNEDEAANKSSKWL